MVIVYTSFSCVSCKKVKKWLKAHGVRYEERNLLNYKMQPQDLDLILKNCDYGFDDIISRRSKIFKEKQIDLETINTDNIKKIIIENPEILKRPIIIKDQKI
ncbi:MULTISPECIES: Spx/MgsR family RNA polymerase-binding regulatory protein [16SrI (Aster yellows group)]|uniref:Spx/MgsR family RNA polymerase-binding regulatory protein n=1 Tax=Candidatus Phytoplasma asteris TaxID=85620 RepID=A0ABZ3CDF1_9MOLU|nr:Spx/MgsR family RNA polymerase-binding regulatory protein [Paulownia witches'-broom phytoplasma]GLH60379.1 regulatory protein Spx [Paulownia witches'-broom phytoplasma]